MDANETKKTHAQKKKERMKARQGITGDSSGDESIPEEVSDTEKPEEEKKDSKDQFIGLH